MDGRKRQWEYDAFIVYSENDKEQAVKIENGLKEQNMRCLADFAKEGAAFPPGVPILTSIGSNVKRSRITLLILTRNSIESSWVKLETVLALEKSKQIGELCLRVVLLEVQPEEVDSSLLKAMDLQNAEKVYVDFTQPDWKERLKASITEEIPVKDLLPTGNIGSGLVFSHYIGYLKYILPELKSKIEECDLYKENPGRMAVHYFMLLPSDCHVQEALESTTLKDGSEIKVERVSEVRWETEYAGKKRVNNPAIHKMEKDGKTVYCVAEFVTIVGAMYEMMEKGLADVNMKLQIARFYFTLDYILNHKENDKFHDTVRFLTYNDKQQWYQEVLWEAVNEELDAQQRKQPEEPAPQQTKVIDRLLSQEPGAYEYDATVSTYSSGMEVDNRLKDTIVTHLEKEGKTVCPEEGKGWDHLRSARWNIFIISKDALKSEELVSKCHSSLTEALDMNQLRMIPVLVGMEPKELPSIFKWITVIPAAHKNFLDLLMHAISGRYVTMEERMPQGDVATGLAYAYLINYLPITLSGQTESGQDFCGRYRTFIEEAKAAGKVPLDCQCFSRMISVAPKSCNTQEPIKDFKDVEYLGAMERVYKSMGGSIRYYCLHVFYFKNLNTCFVAEYATPAATLHEMQHSLTFSGMTLEFMHEQIETFAMMVNGKKETEHFKEKIIDISQLCHVLYYDDECGDPQALEKAFRELLTQFPDDRLDVH